MAPFSKRLLVILLFPVAAMASDFQSLDHAHFKPGEMAKLNNHILALYHLGYGGVSVLGYGENAVGRCMAEDVPPFSEWGGGDETVDHYETAGELLLEYCFGPVQEYIPEVRISIEKLTLAGRRGVHSWYANRRPTGDARMEHAIIWITLREDES